MSENKPYTIQVYPDEPILYIEIFEGYTARQYMDKINSEARVILDQSPEPLFVINDIEDVPLSMDDILYGATAGARGDNPIWQHPNIRGIVWVTTSKITKMGIKGLDSQTFGNLKHVAVDTLEEALEYVRS